MNIMFVRHHLSPFLSSLLVFIGNTIASGSLSQEPTEFPQSLSPRPASHQELQRLKGILRQMKADAMALRPTLDPKPIVHIVMGNETGDLDSVVGAIAYSLVLSQQASGQPETSLVVLPLINVPRRDFYLRTDVVYWLGKFGILEQDLLFIDEINPLELRGQGFEVGMTLIDHNQLAVHQREFQELVTEVIDHRPDQREFSEKVRMEITLDGSVTTTLADRILKMGLVDQIGELAKLLVGPILADTAGLTKRTTERDLSVTTELLARIGGESRDQIWQELVRAKQDNQSLGIAELLRRDPKFYQVGPYDYAISAVSGVPLKEWVHRGGDWAESLQAYRTENDLDILFVMTNYEEGEEKTFGRELLIYTPDPALQLRLIMSLGLEESLPDFDQPSVAAFRIPSESSRKILAERIRESLQAIASGKSQTLSSI